MIRLLYIIVLVTLCFNSQIFAQKITNIILVGPNGVTDDLQKATSFIIVKETPDLHLERLDYFIGAPLVKLRTYKDSLMKILDGRYYEYSKNGSLSISGYYLNNKKTGEWRNYDDSAKTLSLIKYSNDSIVEIVDIERKDTFPEYSDEREAIYPGGDKAWVKYLQSKLEFDNPADKSFQGGKVIVNFIVEIDGSIKDVFLTKSAEFILDEKAIEIIRSSRKWIPAFQNGKNVRAYRRQPLTFIQN